MSISPSKSAGPQNLSLPRLLIITCLFMLPVLPVSPIGPGLQAQTRSDSLDAHRQHAADEEDAEERREDAESVGAEGARGDHAHGVGRDLCDSQRPGDEDGVGRQRVAT